MLSGDAGHNVLLDMILAWCLSSKSLWISLGIAHPNLISNTSPARAHSQQWAGDPFCDLTPSLGSWPPYLPSNPQTRASAWLRWLLQRMMALSFEFFQCTGFVPFIIYYPVYRYYVILWTISHKKHDEKSNTTWIKKDLQDPSTVVRRTDCGGARIEAGISFRNLLH